MATTFTELHQLGEEEEYVGTKFFFSHFCQGMASGPHIFFSSFLVITN